MGAVTRGSAYHKACARGVSRLITSVYQLCFSFNGLLGWRRRGAPRLFQPEPSNLFCLGRLCSIHSANNGNRYFEYPLPVFLEDAHEQ